MSSKKTGDRARRWRRPKDSIKWEYKGRSGVRPAFIVDPESGCWNSTACRTGNRYRGHHGTPAHRDAYERMHGRIPEGFEIHHLCLNTECVNTAHLIAVSREDHGKVHAFLRQRNKER